MTDHAAAPCIPRLFGRREHRYEPRCGAKQSMRRYLHPKASELVTVASELGFTVSLNSRNHLRFEHKETGRTVVCTPDTRGRNRANSVSMLRRVARGAPA